MGKTLLLINCDLNWGSIGRITNQIGVLANKNGWTTHIIYGRDSNPSEINSYKIGNFFNVYLHYIEYRLFDNDGLASRSSTYKLLKIINILNPDLIHLHNIHDHWLNYEVLFSFLGTMKTPVIWTQHDCWAFTGGCFYFTKIGCDSWLTKCKECPFKQNKVLPLIEKTSLHFEKKKRLFTSVQNLTLVPVSKWLENIIRLSFLKEKNICQINNGVDIETFHPSHTTNIRQKLGLTSVKLLMAVASVWEKRKGLDDYIMLSKRLPNDVILILVGLPLNIIKGLPQNIIGLPRTQNVNELVELYSTVDIVLNLSYEETFGLTTVEGLACGTPGIVYNTTASPELITKETGVIVEPGDLDGVLAAIRNVLLFGKSHYSEACRKRAVNFYDKNKCFEKYISLYDEILTKSNVNCQF